MQASDRRKQKRHKDKVNEFSTTEEISALQLAQLEELKLHHQRALARVEKADKAN
jgi:hypothetical protein